MHCRAHSLPLLPPGGEFLPSRHADCGPGRPLSLALPVRALWQIQGNSITENGSCSHTRKKYFNIFNILTTEKIMGRQFLQEGFGIPGGVANLPAHRDLD